MTASLRFVDLFSGIGGFHAALRYSPRLAGDCVYASEIDEACNEVYHRNFNFLPSGDIWPVVRDNLDAIPEHDILCAGFPCQPFSKSGHQRGISEARGTLFHAILLVLEARKPQFVLLENVRNLVGPNHRETWAKIVRLLRELGYAVSSEPTLLSPHELPPGVGSPQIRDRVFIPAVYVGEDLAKESGAYLPALIQRPVFPEWRPSDWRVADHLREFRDPDLPVMPIKPEKVRAIDMWDDFIDALPGRIPRFPIWTDVFLGRLVEGPMHPQWKNVLIGKNTTLFHDHRARITRWAKKWSLGDVIPSYRKFEWQAQEEERTVWAHAIQFRPSGVRVRPLTYLPALVAIAQTPILGPESRMIAPYEAGLLQGFTPPLLGDSHFVPHRDPATAYKQFGNAVHVGVTRFVAETLVLGSHGPDRLQMPIEWQSVIAAAKDGDRPT